MHFGCPICDAPTECETVHEGCAIIVRPLPCHGCGWTYPKPPPEPCARCKEKVSDEAYPCWYCDPVHDLCGDCWDEHGHCGIPEAEAIQEAMRATDAMGRAKIAQALFGDSYIGPPVDGDAQ